MIWPLIIIVVLFFYRDSVENILANLGEISFPGGSAAKIRKEARRAANQAVNKEEQAEGPTVVEIEAAEKISIAALDYDLEAVRIQLRQFAAEYERIRSIMPGGSERRSRMRAVVEKLRTLEVFHYIDCSYVKKIKPENLILFKTHEEAIASLTEDPVRYVNREKVLKKEYSWSISQVGVRVTSTYYIHKPGPIILKVAFILPEKIANFFVRYPAPAKGKATI